MSRNTFIGVLAALACALIGSGWQIMSRHAVTTTLGPLELAVLRYGVPALVLAPLVWRTGLLPKGVSARRLGCMVVGGGLPFGLLALAGVQWAPAAHMGIFLAGSVPLFTAFGARVVFGERLALPRVLGLLMVLAGLAVLGAHSLSSARVTWRGDLLFVAAAMVWALYTLAFRGSGLTPWQGAAVVNAWSALLLLPVAALWGVARLASAPWTDIAWQALGQGVLAGLLGLVTYMVAVVRVGAAPASLSAAVVPVTTALGAAWLLGEPLTRTTVGALVLVVAGVAAAAWGSRHKS
jgi:drug/metabolite transporter (DMT)-like permease